MRAAEISSEMGESVRIPLSFDCKREASVVNIDGIRYHIERISKTELVSEYRVDSDPEYQPQSDADGFCYILAPFSVRIEFKYNILARIRKASRSVQREVYEVLKRTFND